MKSFGPWMLAYLVNSLWQIPLLFAAGWIAARALKRTGAAAQHRVWVTVLLLQTLLPAFSTMPWDWLRPLLMWSGGAQRTAEASVTVRMGTGSTVWHSDASGDTAGGN
jgi:hypothetical protein